MKFINNWLISVGDFVYLSLEHLGSKDDQVVNRQMLKQFRLTKTSRQVTNLYDVRPLDRSSNEKDVFIDINLYLKRDVLPTSLGRFNSRAP
jgi:hypothetical protein